MKSTSGRFTFRCFAYAAMLSLGLCPAFAQSLNWSGGNLATNNGWGSGTAGTSTNWEGNVLPVAGTPVAINVATGNFTPPNTFNNTTGNLVSSSNDTMAFGGSWQITSLTFNNAAGQFPALLRLNANFGAGTGTRNQTILTDSNGMMINVVNGANVLISANSSTTPLQSFVGSNLNLNYSGNGIIHVDRTSSLSIGGNATNFKAVSGQTAAIVKTGEGSLTLGGGGSNYTGGFTLQEGTVYVVASSNTTATIPATGNPNPNYGAGAFGFGGTLTINAGTKLASNGTSTNANRVIDNPVNFIGGTVTLGDTTNNGTVTFSSSVFEGKITLSANTTVNALSNVNFTREVTGSGSLTKTGPGTLSLGTVHTYTGGTIIQGGMLQMSDSDKLPVGSEVTFDGGALRIAGNTSFTANHITTLTSNGATFNIAGGVTLTWSGNISGPGGLSTAGSGATGSLTLSGVNTYAGPTDIAAGKLKVNGSLASAVTIASGADLSGTGTLHGAVQVSGTHHPGNSAGVQTFTGNLTYGTDASIGWELADNSTAAGSFDQVIVGGTLDFAGPTTLALSFVGTNSAVVWQNAFWLEARSWLVFDAATLANLQNLTLSSPATWTDSTGATLETALPGATFTLSQSGQKVYLNYAPVPVIADPYTLWRQEYFSFAELDLPTVSGPLADPDADGLDNLLEYALGLDPRQADSAALPAATAEDGYWVFHYTRPLNRSDVSYSVEVSTDLQSWSTSVIDHEQMAVAGETATWRARYPQTGAPKAFFRLSVTPLVTQ